VAYYVVSGNSTPDCTGDYYATDDYNGYESYCRADSQFYIWDTGSGSQKVISPVRGNPNESWIKNSSGIEGQYDPWINATGVVTVSEGVVAGTFEDDWSW
jgi:hypothetical protein